MFSAIYMYNYPDGAYGMGEYPRAEAIQSGLIKKYNREIAYRSSGALE